MCAALVGRKGVVLCGGHEKVCWCWSMTERIGHLRSLLMSAVRGGSDWVRLTSPLLDAEMNPDGSSSVQVGDGSVAKFDTDASGKRKGRVGSDGSVMEVIIWGLFLICSGFDNWEILW